MTVKIDLDEGISTVADYNQIEGALEKFIEESNELIIAIKENHPIEDVVSELADVFVVATQLKKLLDVSDKTLEDEMYRKVYRTLERIGIL